MSTYKAINGQKVQYLSSDPPAPFVGQVWYNSTSGSLKYNSGTLVQGWSSQPNMNVGRKEMAASGASSTSALSFGGNQAPGPKVNSVESYNGSWTVQTGMPSDRWRNGGTGTQTLALSVGSDSPTGAGAATVDSYNGSWTGQTALPSPKRQLGLTGTTTSALAFGGGPDNSPPQENATLSYNGSWTAQPNMVGKQRGLAASGTETAALAFGGYDQPGSGRVTRTQTYNGSWTEVAGMNNARNYLGGCGTQTNALALAGETGPGLYKLTEGWDGTAWTNLPNMSLAHGSGANGAGANSTSAICFGGGDSPNTGARDKTESFLDNNLGNRIITTS
tara:strand:- start:132 stop:1130 length:999 start_codon:yes stop_codon:yes gene_type:complete